MIRHLLEIKAIGKGAFGLNVLLILSANFVPMECQIII